MEDLAQAQVRANVTAMRLRELVLGVAAVVMCLSRGAAAADPVRERTDADELAIIVAVRDTFGHSPDTRVVIQTEGWERYASPPAKKGGSEIDLRVSQPWDECLDRKAKPDALKRSWCKRNRKDSRLPAHATKGNPFLNFTETREFPHLRFSRVGFTPDGRHALVTFDYACPLCGHGYDVWLNRDDKGWHVERSRMRWVS